MKKTIHTKDYKIKFIKSWWVCEKKNEVKIIVTKTYREEYEGFSREYFEDNLVGTYVLNILNGGVRFYGYEESPSEVSKDKANMLRKEWIEIRKEFGGCKK